MLKSVLQKRKYLLIAGLVVVVVYYIPYLVLGESMFVWHHDFLDSHQAYLKQMKDAGTLFSFNAIFPAMDGVSTTGFDSLYLLRLLLYYLFPPYYAYLAGDAIARIFAFLGMFLLLTYNRESCVKYNFAAFICSVLFGLLQFHCGYYELSSAGIPLILYAFANLKDENRIFLSLLIGVFVSSLASIFLMVFFCCILVFIYYCIICIRDKKTYKYLFCGLLVFGISSLLFSYNTIYNFLCSDVISHRVEFCTGSSLIDSLRGGLNMFFVTQEHTGILPTYGIIILLLIHIFIKKGKINKKIFNVLFSIIGIVSFYVIYNYLKYRLPNCVFIHMFQADRFYFFLPSLWVILLFLIMNEFDGGRLSKFICFGVISSILLGVFYLNPEYTSLGCSLLGKEGALVRYNKFYDEDLFNQIKRNLNINSDTKVIALGMYPSILTYNGMYTCDGYFTSYPLEYKHRFRNVISEELEKSNELKKYFDDWGSRCYLFSSELGRNYLLGKTHDIREVHNLEIDTKILHEMGCRYIISAVKINNFDLLNLSFLGSFATPQSFWELYVYEL